MPRSFREKLQNGCSVDEPDRMPDNISISNFDIFMYVVAIVGHFVDLGLDLNVAVQYCLAQRMVEFGWTLVFILLPAFVNTAVSIRILYIHNSLLMRFILIALYGTIFKYAQDKQQDSITNEVTKRHWLRIFILVLQMAPILRFIDALIYAIKSRRAASARDPSSQRRYYALMLKEDSDAALLRVFECFLEAAPQQLLQMCLLLRHEEQFTVHQLLSITSSIIGMGWCLAAYQRAVRFAQQDKQNMNWAGTLLQILWHFLVTLSRITCLALVAYLYPYWLVAACLTHIMVMTIWLELCDRSPFCAQSKFAQLAFSLALGGVYLFTYILPIEGKTRYRYTGYYILCFIENIACVTIWYLYANDDDRYSLLFYPLLFLGIFPYVLGILFMVVYYMFLHPKVRKGVRDVTITLTAKSAESDS